MTDRRLSEDHPRDPNAARLADAACPLAIPDAPGHDPCGPIGGPYRCDCGWTEPAEEVRLLLTGSGYRRDVDEALADLPDGIAVTPLQADDARPAEIREQIRLACARDAGFLSIAIADMEPHDYQVGADLIIGEVVQPLLARVDQLTAERERARGLAYFRSLEIDRQRDYLREEEATTARWRNRAETAEAKISAVEVIRVWRNEDGRRFLFADEIAVALGVVTQEQLDARAADHA